MMIAEPIVPLSLLYYKEVLKYKVIWQRLQRS